MNAIYLLIPISLIFLGLAIAAFLWAVKARQFDDLESPAMSILLDETKATATTSKMDSEILPPSELKDADHD